MTGQSGGGGVPGVTSDGQTPGGEVIAGSLTAGDPNASTVTPFHTLYGSTVFSETEANLYDGDPVVNIQQGAARSNPNGAMALRVYRVGSGPDDYTDATVRIDDGTNSAQPMLIVNKNNVTQLQVDSDGVQVHGKFKTGAAVTHTLGTYSGKSVPIYDESGTLLGYMPLYA